jgi:predicted phosphodiesterase
MSSALSLWILSDLHLEFAPRWNLPSGKARPNFDVLIVAGDLIPKMERGVTWLLERITDRPVLYVAGNHEFYGCDIDRTVEKARAVARGTNVQVMQNDAVTIDGVLFVGATLWTDFNLHHKPFFAMNKAEEEMNDYSKIRKRNYAQRLRPSDTLARHLQSRDFIKRETCAARGVRKVVVATHHGCVREAARIGTENEFLTGAYTSDCPELLGGVDLWIYGHMHETRDFTINRTRLVSNSKGYTSWSPSQPPDNPRFDPQFVVQI